MTTILVPQAIVDALPLDDDPAGAGVLGDLAALTADVTSMLSEGQSGDEVIAAATGIGWPGWVCEWVVAQAKDHGSDVRYVLDHEEADLAAADEISCPPQAVAQPATFPAGLPPVSAVPAPAEPKVVALPQPPIATAPPVVPRVVESAPPAVTSGTPAAPPAFDASTGRQARVVERAARPEGLYDKSALAPRRVVEIDLAAPLETQNISPLATCFPDWDLLPKGNLVRRGKTS